MQHFSFCKDVKLEIEAEKYIVTRWKKQYNWSKGYTILYICCLSGLLWHFLSLWNHWIWCKHLHILKLTHELIHSSHCLQTWNSFRCMATQQRLWQSEGVQQDDPICPAGDNISQLPGLKGWRRAGNQNNHQSSHMVGSVHSTYRATEQDVDTNNTLEEWWGSNGSQMLTGLTVPPDTVHLLGMRLCLGKSQISVPW